MALSENNDRQQQIESEPTRIALDSAWGDRNPIMTIGTVVVGAILTVGEIVWDSSQAAWSQIKPKLEELQDYFQNKISPSTEDLEKILPTIEYLEEELRNQNFPGSERLADQVKELEGLIITHLEAKKQKQKEEVNNRTQVGASSNVAQGSPKCQDHNVIKQAIEEAIQETLGNLAENHIRNLKNNSFTLPKEKGKLTGIPEAANKNKDVKLQNQAAKDLVKIGYDVEELEQNYKQGQRNPDFKINGKVFDHYVPDIDTNPAKIRKHIENHKLGGQNGQSQNTTQARRFVVNLDNSDIKTKQYNDLARELGKLGEKGAQEIIVMKKGEIVMQIGFDKNKAITAKPPTQECTPEPTYKQKGNNRRSSLPEGDLPLVAANQNQNEFNEKELTNSEEQNLRNSQEQGDENVKPEYLTVKNITVKPNFSSLSKVDQIRLRLGADPTELAMKRLKEKVNVTNESINQTNAMMQKFHEDMEKMNKHFFTQPQQQSDFQKFELTSVESKISERHQEIERD